MRTGTYSEQVSKQLSKTKFDKLKELLNKAEKKIAEQKTLKEQAKILKQIKDELKTPEQIKNYNLWVKSLEDKGIIHQVKVDVKQLGEYQPTTITGEIAIEIPKDIPVGKIGVISIDPSKVRDVSWVGEGTETTQTQSPFARNIFEQPQKVKQFISSTAAFNFTPPSSINVEAPKVFTKNFSSFFSAPFLVLNIPNLTSSPNLLPKTSNTSGFSFAIFLTLVSASPNLNGILSFGLSSVFNLDT